MHEAPAPTAEPVLLLPDVARTWWSWRHVLPHLGGAERTVVALDPRGVGASDRTPSGYAPADVVADLVAVVQACGPPSVLVGHGWGGLSALSLAAHRPDLVAGLALVASPSPPALQRYRRLVVAAGLGPAGAAAARAHRWSGLGEQDPESPCALALRDWPGPQRALAPLRRSSPRALARLRPPPDVPLLHVRASRDPLLPHPRRGVPDAVVLDGTHHLPEQAAPELTAILRTWLATLAGKRDDAGPAAAQPR